MVFCPSFFKNGADPATIVHEMAHATTGGAHITDRGYQGERVMPRLSTEESLTNAESYSEFVSDIVTGQVVPSAAPTDSIQCPDNLKDPLKSSLARAERWTTNSLNIFTSKNEAEKLRLHDQFLPPLLPMLTNLGINIAPLDFPHITAVYKKAHTGFQSPLQVVCQDAKDAACARGPEVQFHAGDPKLYICPAWQALDADHRVLSLLGALYGTLGGETNPAWRTGLANIAQAITNTDYSVPTRQDVVGDAAWTPADLTIFFKREPPVIPAVQEFYRENRTSHMRVSADLPTYAGPDCAQSTLPFNFSVLFTVDRAAHPRPGPFTPPTVSIAYWFQGGPRDASVDYREEDSNARYNGANSALSNKLKNPFRLNFTHNGTFHMNFRMEDPDSKTVVVYTDQIPVQASRPCAPPPPTAATGTPVVNSDSGQDKAPGPSKTEEA